MKNPKPDAVSVSAFVSHAAPARRARLHARVGRTPRASWRAAVAFAIGSCAVSFACGTTTPPPASVKVEPAPPPVNPGLQPPTFTPPPVATPEQRQDRRTAERRDILDAVWRTVRDVHYDPRLGGIDWIAVRRRYEPIALGAPSDGAFYRALNDMVGELGQSHMMVTGPGANDDEDDDSDTTPPSVPTTTSTTTPSSPSTSTSTSAPTGSTSASSIGSIPAATSSPAGARPGVGSTAQPAPASLARPAPAPNTIAPPGTPVAAAPMAVTGVGDPGLTIRVIDGRPTVTAVRPGSSAARRGLAPGFIVTRIGGRPLSTTVPSHRPLRPVEERFALRRAALHRLQGPTGTKVTVEYLDNDDRPGQVILDREEPNGPVRQIGHLPPLHPEARIAEVNGVGVIAFNIFLLDPLLSEIKLAMDRFRTMHVKGVIIDLRGNPGGLGAMAIPIAAEFVSAPTTLGTLQFRTFSQTFTAQPSIGRTPYTGPLVILTDEGTASASEILAAGLQEAGRARIVGDATLGAVLPSVVESLPHGAVMQVVVADFKTPKGILLEGRGVQPDRRVSETRAGFRANHDVVMDAAVATIKAPRARR